jgi:hypothetical protein
MGNLQVEIVKVKPDKSIPIAYHTQTYEIFQSSCVRRS